MICCHSKVLQSRQQLVFHCYLTYTEKGTSLYDQVACKLIFNEIIKFLDANANFEWAPAKYQFANEFLLSITKAKRNGNKLNGKMQIIFSVLFCLLCGVKR